MSTMTRPTGIKCGNCRDRHTSVDEVKACYAQMQANVEAQRAELAAEQAYERHLEDRGFDDARAQEDHEARTGAVSFEEDRRRWEGSEYGHEPHTAGYEAQRSWGQEKTPDLADGIYRNPQTGDIFKIYRTVHGANQTVAKRLVLLDEPYTKTSRGKEVEVRAEFIYEGKKGLRGLTSEMRMTLEEAKKYGALYGVCVRCCLTLTREESIERSMGPVCAKKANWA